MSDLDATRLTEWIIRKGPAMADLGQFVEGLCEHIVRAGLPIIFSDGSVKSVTFATKVESGFTDEMLLFLERIRSAISVVLETYVGNRTGHRVMAGEIRRGDGQSIDAVVFFSDLRDFTELSGSFSNRKLVDILNFYFESITESIEDEGGEVLRFIGDAVLAIIRCRSAASSASLMSSSIDSLPWLSQTK